MSPDQPLHQYTVNAYLIGAENHPCTICGEGRQGAQHQSKEQRVTECLACNDTGFMGSESNPGRSYCPVCPAGKDRRYEDRDAKREADRAHYEAKAKEAHDRHVSIVLDALVVADQKAWADTQLDLSLRETAEIAVTALENDGVVFARMDKETP